MARGLPVLPESKCRSLCNVSVFPLSATALQQLHLSRNLAGDLPSQTVGPDGACHIRVPGNKSLQA